MKHLRVPSWAVGVFLGLAVIGFTDATYLAVEHYMGVVPPCTILKGCDTVTTSQYSTIAGISVALFGSLYYLGLICLSIYILTSKKFKLIRYLGHWTWLGLLAAIYFTSLQVFVIRAYCIYCLTSALISLIVFIAAQELWRRERVCLEIH